jgi:hypothetical protein
VNPHRCRRVRGTIAFGFGQCSRRVAAARAFSWRGRRVAEDEHTVFLKTIIPSRKATKEYLGEGVRP